MNLVLPAINSTNKNVEEQNNSDGNNALKSPSILKLPSTILGKVKINKNSKAISNENKATLKNLIDTLIGNNNSKNRMRAMDVQRVINIINEMEKKILILNMIPKQLDVVFKIDIGTKPYSIIKVYNDIEKELISCQKQCETSKVNLEDNENYIEITHQYRTIIRRICRMFIQDKSLFNRLYQSYKRRMEGAKNDEIKDDETDDLTYDIACKKFEQYIKEIKVFFEERLMESVEEEEEQRKKIEHIIAKEEQTNKQIDIVRNSLNEINMKRFYENKEKEKIIEKMSNELESLRKNSVNTKKRIFDTSIKKNDGTKMLHKQKTDMLKLEIEQLEKQYNELLQQNSEEELNLRKKSYKVEGEVENWIHKYDQEVGERHNELEALIKRYNEGNQALSIQKDRYKEISEEYHKIEIRKEEERIEEERLEKIRQLTWKNNALRIQKVWKKFYAAHGPFRASKKRGKKGKKGKKGGGGKKKSGKAKSDKKASDKKAGDKKKKKK